MAEWRCDLCRAGEKRKRSARIAECRACALVFTDPQPSAEELQKRYPETYYAGWDGGGNRAKLWAWRLAYARRFLSPGRLLDVGCGSGEFLRVALAAGFDACGTEFSAAARAFIKHAPVYERPRTAPGDFDAITMWHVLEHTPSPRAMLSEVREKLGPGGRLIIAVPNLDSHWFDLVYRCVKLKKNELYTEETKEPHLFHFSTTTLRRYLDCAGFRVLEQNLDTPDYADTRKLIVDAPARVWYRLTGVNWTLTQTIVSQKI